MFYRKVLFSPKALGYICVVLLYVYVMNCFCINKKYIKLHFDGNETKIK